MVIRPRLTIDHLGPERRRDRSLSDKRGTLSWIGDDSSRSESDFTWKLRPILISRLSEQSNLLMTPFERNIQLWRQLWRVLERSHLIVQIVDARNPLGFRCADLDNYVQDIGDDGASGEDITVPGKGKRRSLLLINKADLLTIEQRLAERYRW